MKWSSKYQLFYMLSPTQLSLFELTPLMVVLLWTRNQTAWPDNSIFVVWSLKPLNICLKRPSYYCLIHFYKRCVSALAWWVAHLRVRSGWVSVFVSHKPSLFKAKESLLYKRIALKTNNFLTWTKCIINFDWLQTILISTDNQPITWPASYPAPSTLFSQDLFRVKSSKSTTIQLLWILYL